MVRNKTSRNLAFAPASNSPKWNYDLSMPDVPKNRHVNKLLSHFVTGKNPHLKP